MCSPWTDLTRAPDGRVMCCICMEWFERAELARDENEQLWDVCVPCAPQAGIKLGSAGPT